MSGAKTVQQLYAQWVTPESFRPYDQVIFGSEDGIQNEYFTGKLPVTYPPENLDNILKVMNVASVQGIPVIVIRHTQPTEDTPIFRKGSPEWELHPDIAKQPYSLLIEKDGFISKVISTSEWVKTLEVIDAGKNA